MKRRASKRGPQKMSKGNVERSDLRATAALGRQLNYVWDRIGFVKGKRCNDISAVLAVVENALVSMTLSIHQDLGAGM